MEPRQHTSNNGGSCISRLRSMRYSKCHPLPESQNKGSGHPSGSEMFTQTFSLRPGYLLFIVGAVRLMEDEAGLHTQKKPNAF